jgi:hypothetical protein
LPESVPFRRGGAPVAPTMAGRRLDLLEVMWVCEIDRCNDGREPGGGPLIPTKKRVGNH